MSRAPSCVLTISREIAAPADSVWRVLTTPALMKRWMLVPARVVPDAALTQASRIEWRDADDRVYLTGSVMVCQPQRCLRIELEDRSWPRAAAPGEVVWEFTLHPGGRRTRLDYRLGDLAIDADAENWLAAYRQADEPARIAALLEGMTMGTEIACLCRSLRLRLHAAPQIGFWCHCADCRAAQGAAYVGVALYPSEAVEVVAGEVATHTIRNLPRSFCPRCGTRMFARVPGIDTTGVVATRLPEGAFKPAFHIHCAEAVAPVHDGLPHYATLPSLFGGDDRTIDW
jgi:uncharacterized protein YndB with AHSA1/START domain